jgi:ADP-ribose pyrophosphatase YjhB (NUDIX family)
MVAIGVRPQGKRGTSIVAIRRGIDPGLGGLALPGGFVEVGESWQAAASRELYEETGIQVEPDNLHILHVESNKPGDRLLLFCRPYILFSEDELPEFAPSEEAVERVLVTQAQDLIWPSHRNAARIYLRYPSA